MVGPIGPLLKDLLPDQIQVPSDSRISDDEVHLIMEYGLYEQWGPLTAPVANRFITSYDESNSKLTSLEKFFKSIIKFGPDLVLLSGLHLLESQELSYVKEKIKEVKLGLKAVPAKTPVHLELASMAHKDAVKMILNDVSKIITYTVKPF